MAKIKKILNKIFRLPPLPTVWAAMVSILSLTTAMLAQFGGDNAPAFRKIMTGATGGSVCTIVIGMAVYMIWRADKWLKRKK